MDQRRDGRARRDEHELPWVDRAGENVPTLTIILLAQTLGVDAGNLGANRRSGQVTYPIAASARRSSGRGRAGARGDRRNVCPANGSDAKLRGQGPRAEADAAHGVHACESRDAGRAPPPGFDSNEAARPPDRSRAAPASAAS